MNVAITNVPGSQVPLYVAGARQVSMVPMAPVIDTVGMIICISSSDRHLSMGFHGCGEAIKDAELFVAGARQCFSALAKAAAPRSKAATATTKRTATKKPPIPAKNPIAKTAVKKKPVAAKTKTAKSKATKSLS